MSGARAAYSRRQPVRKRKTSKLFVIITVIAIIIAAAACIKMFACSASEVPDDAANQTRDAQTAGSGEDQDDAPSSEQPSLTANEKDRTRSSASANDAKPAEKVVYLTFDDGPSSNTHKIMDTLDGYGIKATWFVLGNTGHLDYVEEIWDRGHQIGLHSNEHDYDYVYSSPEAFVTDIERIGSAVEEHLGFTPTLIRFPGGSVNGYNSGRADGFKQAATDHGWHYFDWNVSIGDSTQPPAAVETLVANIEREAQGCNSACVLMHDSDFKPTTADALPQVIEYFISEGFTFDVLASDSFGYHF